MTIREEILSSIEQKRLVAYLDEIRRAEATDEDVLVEELIKLEDAKEINLAEALIEGDIKDLEYHHLYRIKQLLGSVIGIYPGSIHNLMELVDSCLSIGQQRSGEAILPAFEEWLGAKPKEMRDGFKIIESTDNSSTEAYAPIIRMALATNHKRYFDQVLKLIHSENTLLATVALRSLSSDTVHLSRASADKILESIKIPNSSKDLDLFGSGIIFSITEMAKARKIKHSAYFPLLVDALSIEGPNIIHACTQALSRNSDRLPQKVASSLLKRIDNIKASESECLNDIGWALSRLLKTKHSVVAIRSVEKLMHRRDIDGAEIVFDEMNHYLATDHVDKLEELFVRWFLTGSPKHCNSLVRSVQKVHGSPPEYKFSTVELAKLSDEQLLFVCRKTIGFLFHFPVTAAALLVSALSGKNKDIRAGIEDLLYYPIMISNSASVGAFLKRVKKGKPRDVQSSIRSVLKKHEEYLSGLKSVGEISEFHLSAQERSIVMNRDNDTFTEASERPENRSALLDSIATKQILLHGSGSISYHKDLNDNKTYRRFVTKLQSHSFSYELPRLASIDAPGLQFMLWRFKTEKIV